MAWVSAILIAFGLAFVMFLILPWFAPLMDPLFDLFGRYCDWVDRKMR
jgi:hypothetical protein